MCNAMIVKSTCILRIHKDKYSMTIYLMGSEHKSHTVPFLTSVSSKLSFSRKSSTANQPVRPVDPSHEGMISKGLEDVKRRRRSKEAVERHVRIVHAFRGRARKHLSLRAQRFRNYVTFWKDSSGRRVLNP